MHGSRNVFIRIGRNLITLSLPVVTLVVATSRQAQSTSVIRATRHLSIRATDGIALGRCGTLTVNLRAPNLIHLRIMAISTYPATITMTTDSGVVLTQCKKTTKTCYGSWQAGGMRRGQNKLITEAVGSNSCSISIMSYIDVQ